jgi:plasmid maintenance system antidote protein VapI
MDARSYWKAYVDRTGGLRAVSERLGLPYSTVTSITNGHRGIGRDLAARIVEADSELDASVLVWVRPTQTVCNDMTPGKRAA